MNVSPGLYCKFRNPTTSYRRRRYRSSGTPFSDWKVDDKQRASRGRGVTLSARKLAAGLWQLRFLSQHSGGGGVKYGSSGQLRLQHHPGHGDIRHPLQCSSREYGAETKDPSQSRLLGCNPKPKIRHKHESSLPYLKLAMEAATKWDPSFLKFPEGRFTTFSVAAALRAELVQAQLRVSELEDELQSSEKKYEHLMRKLGEEKKLWQSKHDKMCTVIEDLKNELSMGRKSQKRIEIINSKLIKELAGAKSSAKQFMQDYEEEKRAGELMEEVCNELAMKIGEDKAEMEQLKIETLKICEELEEERRMLQLAEVWREERVQMKLLDAKLALEEKYCQMDKVVTDLESFLRSINATPDVMELRKAELIIHAVKSVNIQDTKEFEYMTPPKSGGVFSKFGEIRQDEANEREMEPVIKYSPIGDSSNYHTVSPKVNDFNNNHALEHSNGFVVCNNGLEEDARILEQAGHANDLSSIYSIEGNDHSDIVIRGQIDSRSRMDGNESTSQDSSNTKISDGCSISGEPGKKKACLTSDEFNGRLSNGKISNLGTASPHRKSVEGGLRQRDSVQQSVSPDYVNPHITRGMKGPVEWPRGIQKNSLKAKCLKAIIDSQKTQLRNVLK